METNWIRVDNQSELPLTNIIAINEYGHVSNIYPKDNKWWIETFGGLKIEFEGTIEYYINITTP